MDSPMRMTKLLVIVLVHAVILGSLAVVPAFAGMQDDVDQAVNILQRFKSIPEKEIPPIPILFTLAPSFNPGICLYQSRICSMGSAEI